MSSVNPREYIKNILVKNCDFEFNSELSREILKPCLEVPSAKEALLLAMYSNAFFISGDRVLPIRTPSLSISEEEMEKFYKVLFSESPPKSVPKSYKSVIEDWRSEFPNAFEGGKKLVISEKVQPPNWLRNKDPEEQRVRLWEKTINTLRELGELEEFLLGMEIPSIGGREELFINESFFDYMAGVVLKDKGYLVMDALIAGTAADMVGVKGPRLSEVLEDIGASEGFLAEVILNEMLGKTVSGESHTSGQDEAAVIEAESTRRRTKAYHRGSGFGQAERYLRSGNFNRGYSTGPLCSRKHEKIGTISFDEGGELFFNEGTKSGGAKRTVEFVCGLVKKLSV